MNELTFSVVVPTFRRPSLLARTLECLENQRFDRPFEVIVVNDGPPAELPSLGFGAGRRAGWRLIQNPANCGRAVTRNKGLQAAKGRYVLMLDDDIWAVPGLMQAHFDKQVEIGGGVVVGAVPPEGSIEPSVWHRYLVNRYRRIEKRLTMPSIDFTLFFTGNVSVPRSLFDAVGVFDETFRNYSYEDTEMGYRFSQAGVRFVHAPGAIGCHVLQESLDSLANRAYQMGRSCHVFISLHPELRKTMQYHSHVPGPWRRMDIPKNLLKMTISSKGPLLLMRLLLSLSALLRWDGGVMTLLPWYEYGLRIRGVRHERKQ